MGLLGGAFAPLLDDADAYRTMRGTGSENWRRLWMPRFARRQMRPDWGSRNLGMADDGEAAISKAGCG